MSPIALNWIVGRDTGASSIAIWAHMMGAVSDGSSPVDPDDFGRCYRLLSVMPEWRDRIGEMAVYSKPWRRLVAKWDELSMLFEEETGLRGVATWRAVGSAPRTYALMKECRA